MLVGKILHQILSMLNFELSRNVCYAVYFLQLFMSIGYYRNFVIFQVSFMGFFHLFLDDPMPKAP